MSAKPTAYSYVRFSTPEQQHGDSFHRQTSLAQAYCDRKGLTLSDTTFRDLGVSAYRGANALVGNLGEFLKAVEGGAVKPGSVLVVESLDRISRQGIDEGYDVVKKILKSGVRLVTLAPEREFDETATKSLSRGALEIMLILERAAEESERKAHRLAHAWGTKRAKAATAKLTARCPAWLRLREDRTAFVPLPDRAAVVKRVYRMAADGYGYGAIAKALNGEQVPPFGNGKRTAELWGTSSVKKLLGTRAVLGEYQPHTDRDGQRAKAGEPVKGYYPAVVTEAEYYAARSAIATRRGTPEDRGDGERLYGGHGGSSGERVSNLFTGLLKDARDGSPLHLVDKGDGPALVSSSARKGATGSVYLSFPYPAFERAMLVWGHDLPLADALPKPGKAGADELAAAEAKLADVTDRLAKLKDKLRTAPNLDVLMEVAGELEQERTDAKAAVDKAKTAQALPAADAAGGLKPLLKALHKATGDELVALRLKLRRLLARLVEDVVVLVVAVSGERVAVADVTLAGGVRRKVVIGGTPGKLPPLPDGMGKLDVRQWAKWPAKFRQTHFTGPDTEAQQAAVLEAEGYSRQDIAAQLGWSATKCTRVLLRAGRRKHTRKAADDPRVMSWHAAGRGWAKTHKGERYFVGMGTLVAMYPKLVTDKTADGSWKAANRWWADNVGGQG